MKKSIGVIGLKGLPAFGGAATVGQNIINNLWQEYNFTVYSVESHIQKEKSDTQEKFKHVIFKTFPILKLNVFMYYLKSAIYALFKGKHDLIHLHHIDGAFILLLLRLKYKVILTSHARPQVAEKWPVYVKVFFSINEKISIKLANKFTCVAKNLQQFYSKKYKREFIYIPNGISLEDSPSKTELPFNEYILFAAGRIIPLKGLHLLLQALINIKYKGKLIVLGDINQMPKYKTELLTLSESLDVEYIGLIKKKANVLNYLNQAKLFVFPSTSENMSIMLLEAASMEVPIVCSDIIENKDVFSNEEVIYFSSNDSDDLTEKISNTLNEYEKVDSYVQNAKNKLLSTYLWFNISKQYSHLYNQLIIKS